MKSENTFEYIEIVSKSSLILDFKIQGKIHLNFSLISGNTFKYIEIVSKYSLNLVFKIQRKIPFLRLVYEASFYIWKCLRFDSTPQWKNSYGRYYPNFRKIIFRMFGKKMKIFRKYFPKVRKIIFRNFGKVDDIPFTHEMYFGRWSY